MTNEKAIRFSKVRYRGDYIFAFDNINDKDMIEKKLTLWREHVSKNTKLYVFCGFDFNDKWDQDFWEQDIVDTFERIKILMKYYCFPYIMRFERYEESPYRGMYITLARWCNQPSFFRNKSFREYVMDVKGNGVGSASHRYMTEFEEKHPEIAKKYFDLKMNDITNYPKGVKKC